MDEAYIGSIVLFAGNFAPRGWALCQGQTLSIAQYSALFSILGTMYGGNGTTTFNLPDLRGRAPIGVGQGPGLAPYTQGQMAGVENVTLAANQMPIHNHLLNVSNGGATTPSPVNATLAAANGATEGGDAVTVNAYGTDFSAAAAPNSVGPAGGNMPHSNMQPYLVLNYIICLQGIYPSRD